VGDILPPGNFVEVVVFPNEGLDRAEAQITPTINEIDARYGADAAISLFEAMPANTPNTELLQVRRMMPIPMAYLPLVLGENLTPRQLWTRLGGAIRHDGRQDELMPLMKWLRVATTKAGVLSQAPQYPATCLPTTVIPVPAATLQAQRWSILCEDFPHLTTPSAPAHTPIDHLINTLREERAADRALDAAHKLIAAQPKSPAIVFPHTHLVWMRYCRVNNPDQLPNLYHSWASAPNKERRQTFEATLEERCRNPHAATNLGPLASKELFELVMTGRFCPSIQETNDLSKGISPFTCGFQRGSRDPASIAATTRINSFDLMQSGSTAPTLAEQAYLTSSEVVFPNSIHATARQLNNTSIVLDVVLGEDHLLAVDYRKFCKEYWPTIEAYLYANDPSSSHQILPLILRWMHLEIGAYLRALSDERPATLPTFSALTETITRNAYHLLPPLPPHYLAQAAGGLTRGPTLPPTPSRFPQRFPHHPLSFTAPHHAPRDRTGHE
jgi:hypothetical protein